MIEKHIVLEEIDPALFYGANNANLQMIKALFPKLRIMARGNVIRAMGDDGVLGTFENYVKQLEEHGSRYNSLKEDAVRIATELKENPEWPWAAPPYYCQADSYVGDYWRENRKLSPVVYIRQSVWKDRDNAENGIRKEDVICLTADM